MGGYGALHLGLTYPRAFGVAVGINGPYDWSGVIPSDWWQRIASDPKDLNDFNSLPDAQRGPLLRIMARAAAGAANPAKAPFYFDKPYTIVDGQAQVIPDVERKIRACDVLHDLDSYVRQPDSLNAIMLVHGVNDDMVPVTQARDLSKKMKALGVVHVYEEHNLGHGGIPNTWIAFMVDNLAARRLQIFGRAPARDNAGDWDMFIHNLPGGLRMRRPGLAF
jgi:S-formylglutathione hydrolase FrmB